MPEYFTLPGTQMLLEAIQADGKTFYKNVNKSSDYVSYDKYGSRFPCGIRVGFIFRPGQDVYLMETEWQLDPDGKKVNQPPMPSKWKPEDLIPVKSIIETTYSNIKMTDHEVTVNVTEKTIAL